MLYLINWTLWVRLFMIMIASSSVYSSPPPKVADVPHCSDHVVVLNDFMMSTGNGSFPMRTDVQLCWNEWGLAISFQAYGDNYTQNTASQCNAALYNQEVVEMFMTAGANDPTLYAEIEISPNNLIYASAIENPFYNSTNLSHTYYPKDCTKGCGCDRVQEASGIRFEATIDHDRQMWKGLMDVPWSTINWNQPGIPKVLRGNFFRIVMREDMQGKDCPAVSETGPCLYGAWTPTYVDPPSFHWPHYFATFNIKSKKKKTAPIQ